MATSAATYLKGFYDRIVGKGRKAISSDFTVEIEGFEDMYLLTKQCPWPVISSTGEIEVPMPLGSAMWEKQQIKVNQQGPIAFFETVAGSVDQMLVSLIANGGMFNAKIYHGVPGKYIQAKRITDCFIQIDNPDTDWENRSQVLMFSGTMFFHYFGETIPGNSVTI